MELIDVLIDMVVYLVFWGAPTIFCINVVEGYLGV